VETQINVKTNFQKRAIIRKSGAGRYAPSPTGPLHLGNLRTAILAWRDAREAGADFILRIEDIDIPRTVPGSESGILRDLSMIGIEWDEGPDLGGPADPYRQSEREAIYRDALMFLAQKQMVYPCTCSRKDLKDLSSAPHGPDGPVYPGTCAGFESTGSEWLEQILNSRAPETSIRFRVPRIRNFHFHDNILGPQICDMITGCGDFVVRRRDGLWAYQFACAVDDGLMGITRVVRGADLLTSTPKQITLLNALELPVPAYMHVPLVRDQTGNRLSKRDGAQSLEEMLATYSLEDIINHLTSLSD